MPLIAGLPTESVSTLALHAVSCIVFHLESSCSWLIWQNPIRRRLLIGIRVLFGGDIGLLYARASTAYAGSVYAPSTPAVCWSLLWRSSRALLSAGRTHVGTDPFWFWRDHQDCYVPDILMPRMDARVDACRFMKQQCEKKCGGFLLQRCSSLVSPGAGWFGVVMRCGSRSENTADLIE